jgi:mannosyl-3-phosphoglycerate phosphatase
MIKKVKIILLLIFGADYGRLKKIIELVKKKFEIQSFLDMSVEEIARDADLDLKQAKLAKKREYVIPFKILNKDQEKQIIEYIKNQNLKVTKGGRYYHLMGENNKGEAVKILSQLYKLRFGDIYTVGIGDSENDFAMLDVVDSPYLVMKKDGSYASSNYSLAGGIGPVGWKKVIDIEWRA